MEESNGIEPSPVSRGPSLRGSLSPSEAAIQILLLFIYGRRKSLELILGPMTSFSLIRGLSCNDDCPGSCRLHLHNQSRLRRTAIFLA